MKNNILTALILSTALFATPFSAMANQLSNSNPLYNCKQTQAITSIIARPDNSQISTSNNLRNPVGSGFNSEGIEIEVRGRILDSSCQAISDAQITIWQHDNKGRSGASKSQYFTGSGRTYSNNLGEFAFYTIMPASNDDNLAPSINFSIIHDKFDSFETIMYFPKHPKNKNDPTFKQAAESDFGKPIAQRSQQNIYNFNITLPENENFREY